MKKKQLDRYLLLMVAVLSVFFRIVYGQEQREELKPIKINPSTVVMQKGDTQQFTAHVEGEEEAKQTFIWRVQGGHLDTHISTNGLLTISEEEIAPELIVTATSTSHIHQVGKAIVSVIDKLTKRHNLTVVNGIGSGLYEANTEVVIRAIVPEGKIFDHWEVTNGIIVSITSPTTTVKIQDSDVIVIAYFRDML